MLNTISEPTNKEPLPLNDNQSLVSPPSKQMSSLTYIIGHKNPDADSICAAIAYASFKNAIGEKGCVAARCGNTNARIDAILSRFNVQLPLFIGDVSPRVRDIMKSNVSKVEINATCARALEVIDEKDIRALPVVDKDQQIQGVISIFDLGEFFIPKPKDLRRMRRVHANIANIINALNATTHYVRDSDIIEDLYVRIGAMDIHNFGTFTASENTGPEESIIVVGDRYDIQQKSIQLGVRLLVVTGNATIDKDVIAQAKKHGVSLITSPYDSATTSWIIRAATQLAPLINRNVVRFSPDEKLKQVQRKVAKNISPIYCVVDDSDKLVGIFSKTDLLRPINTKVILVDHNEIAQAVNGVSDVNIVEVIDHHRLSNPPTNKPIFFRNEIIGSTCSIIALMFRERGLVPSPEIAGIMMGGLISDTLNLHSPTSTQRDAELLPWLATIAGVKIQEIADLVFESGSVILNSKPDNIIQADCKSYTQNNVNFSVSQVEELGYRNFWKKASDIFKALESFRKENQFVFSCLLVTDINTQSSLLLITGKEEIVADIIYDPVDKSHIFDLPGIVSRKKQLIPYLTRLIDEAGL